MEEDDYLFFFSISFERFVVSAMIFFFSYRMNILVR